ncbi:cupin domain-containing protein [Thermodesulfobacteriota bacterium]
MAFGARMYLIENDGKGIPRATSLPDVAWGSLQEALGMESAGDMGMMYAAEASGKEPVGMMMVTCEPGGVIATHTGPQTFMCYLVQGRGKLTLQGGEPLDYQPGDLFVFKPETLHGWENGEETTVVLVVAVS